MPDRRELHANGYAMLRSAIGPDTVEALRAIFDANVLPSDQWPVPRGQDWRHAQLDLAPVVQATCRLPALLAVVGELIGERFFIAQAEGREPLPGGGHQQLHRDLSARRPGDMVNALVFLDDFAAHNGATRIIPGSHRPQPDAPPEDFNDESRAVHLQGRAGDILVFDVDLVHGGSLNASGARRRSMLISYRSEQLHATHLATTALRNVRMDTTERFAPTGNALATG
ncbi:phytanoyl-CoA dioxygenase family protein [Pseudomonas sp. GCEP-101]|uniref:phytanoyl-CoA dioxygenase family protein n=1 Tax=Pseudomonas sp. GCEP-101 TaxID=2974552 RepID=UPI00223ABABB|nr:phytanoyl-CoA dioxygenase family protein [Pseudomonas sp. GCEP-101]